MKKYKGNFTTDINDTYWSCRPVYYSEDYFKAKITFYYKNSDQLKGIPIQKGTYKIYYKNIKHWSCHDISE